MEISSCFHVPASQELFNHLDQKQLLARRQNNDANITDLLVEQTWEDKDGIDEDVSSLGLFVGHNTHIQKIELNGPGLIRPYERDWEPAEFSRQRWRLFAEGMKKNRSIKEIVFVDFREHVWDVVRMLSPFFKCNQALKKVYFLDSQGLHQNGGGLQCLLSSILSRSCPLNEIIFGYDDMSDDMVRAMASSLIRNAPTTPRKITLSPFNQQIGSNGFECLAGVLKSSECIIEELILGGRNFGDNMARRFGKALEKNNILRVLDCSGCVELNMISDSGWNSFESVLCDKTSINATYLSNHTLISRGEFSANNNPLPVDLRRHLEWNRNENKRLVARTKVLAHHLMVDSNTNPLKELGPSLLLHAIELVDNVIAENGGEEGLGVGRNVRCTFLFSLLKCNHMMIQGRRR